MIEILSKALVTRWHYMRRNEHAMEQRESSMEHTFLATNFQDEEMLSSA